LCEMQCANDQPHKLCPHTFSLWKNRRNVIAVVAERAKSVRFWVELSAHTTRKTRRKTEREMKRKKMGGKDRKKDQKIGKVEQKSSYSKHMKHLKCCADG
jgi:hypothetical protein